MRMRSKGSKEPCSRMRLSGKRGNGSIYEHTASAEFQKDDGGIIAQRPPSGLFRLRKERKL